MSLEPTRKYGGPIPGQPRSPVKDINTLPVGFVSECLDYDPDTGILRWKNRPISHFPSEKQCIRWNGAWAGKIAGSKKCRKSSDHRSTIQICISKELPESDWVIESDGRVRRSKSVLYSAHRLAFIIMGQDVPVNMVIDHINNDPWDNRWSNLQLTTQKENCRNRKSCRNKKSGLPRNVFRSTHGGTKIVYEARVSSGGFDTPDEALAWRNWAEITLYGKVLNTKTD